MGGAGHHVLNSRGTAAKSSPSQSRFDNAPRTVGARFASTKSGLWPKFAQNDMMLLCLEAPKVNWSSPSPAVGKQAQSFQRGGVQPSRKQELMVFNGKRGKPGKKVSFDLADDFVTSNAERTTKSVQSCPFLP